MDRQIIHVDMDAFFVAVEVLDNLALAGKCVIVGGDPQARGVVSTASYEARRFGVHSAMPMAQALRLCPDAIVIDPHGERYSEISHAMLEIFRRYTPLVEPVSIDEAFLDVTGSYALWGDARTIAVSIQTAIRQEQGLSASLGIAPNKFLAKLASDLEKPGGLVEITEANKRQILGPLPVSKIWGVGKVTTETLGRHGIRTIAELRAQPLDALRRIVGNFAGELLQLAQGIDDRPVSVESEVKSISKEHTFARDCPDFDKLLQVLLEQVDDVSRQLRQQQFKARTVTLKLRFGNFQTITRSHTLGGATDVTGTLWQAAHDLFEAWWRRTGCPIRLIGFAASGLEPAQGGQKLLFEDLEEEKGRKIDQVADAIRARFGDDAVTRASCPRFPRDLP